MPGFAKGLLRNQFFDPIQDSTVIKWLDASTIRTLGIAEDGFLDYWDDKSSQRSRLTPFLKLPQLTFVADKLVTRFSDAGMTFSPEISVGGAFFVVSNPTHGFSYNTSFQRVNQTGFSALIGRSTLGVTNSRYAIATARTNIELTITGGTDNSGIGAINGESLKTGATLVFSTYPRITTLANTHIFFTASANSPAVINTIGSYATGANYFLTNMNFHEIIFLSTRPATNLQQKFEGYLAHKWRLLDKLPTTHPYKVTQPRR